MKGQILRSCLFENQNQPRLELLILKCNAKESKELERDTINKKFFYLNQTYKQQAPQMSWSGFIVFLANTWPAHLASRCTVGGDGWWLMHGQLMEKFKVAGNAFCLHDLANTTPTQ